MILAGLELAESMSIDVGRVGVWVFSRAWPQEHDEVAAAAAELEELGYGAVWLGAADGGLRLPEQVLGATSRLVAATGIVNVWAGPAAAVAEAFHRVDAAHPARLLLGIGAGHATSAQRVGQSYDRPYSKVVDYLDHLDSAGVPTASRAIAALGPRIIALAGERSAGAHPYLTTPEHTRTAREILGEGPLLAPEHKVVLANDRERAREIAGPVLQRYLELPNYTRNLRRLGFTDDDVNTPGGSNRLFDAIVAWGDTEAIAARIAEHHGAGADHVGVQVLTGEPGLPRAQWSELAPALTG